MYNYNCLNVKKIGEIIWNGTDLNSDLSRGSLGQASWNNSVFLHLAIVQMAPGREASPTGSAPAGPVFWKTLTSKPHCHLPLPLISRLFWEGMAFFRAGTETDHWGAGGWSFSFLPCLANCLLGTCASRQLSHNLIIWSPTVDDTENVCASLGEYLVENIWTSVWKSPQPLCCGGRACGVSRMQRAQLCALRSPQTCLFLPSEPSTRILANVASASS